MEIMEQIDKLVAFLELKNPLCLPDVGVPLPQKAENTEMLAVYWTHGEDVIRWFAWDESPHNGDEYNAHSGTLDVHDYLRAIKDRLEYLALEKLKKQDAMEAKQRLDAKLKRFIDVQEQV